MLAHALAGSAGVPLIATSYSDCQRHGHQGDMLAAMNAAFEQAAQQAPAILFIDEMHQLVGAGKSEGAMDAANLLKPALARGELHCIGATTLDEYRNYIEKDSALARRFQPVYVDDVARAAVAGAMGQAPAGIYELGGPDVETFAELMARMKSVIQRRPLTLSLPKFVAWCVAFGADMAQAITFGLFTNSILTRDQLKQLQNDNVVADDAKTLGDLGIEATSMASILPDYLWCYRPSGQYAAIKNSAKNLKSS